MPHKIESVGRTIYAFGRDEDGEAYVKKEDFSPYFYAIGEGDYQDVFGNPARKIKVDKPGDVYHERKKYDKTGEANVRFTNRYLIDNFDGIISKEPLRICYIDIETEVKGEFPNPDQPKNAINCIGCYDNFLEKYNIFAVPPGINKEQHHSVITEVPDNVNLHLFSNEVGLMNGFIKYIRATDPDILTAWYGDKFDFPYIINRFKKQLFTSAYDLARMKKPYVDKYGPVIPGRVLFDLLFGYKYLIKKGQESFSLDYIGKLELGIGKEEYEGSLQDLYENDFQKFIDYNIRDVEIMKKLDEELMITKFFDTSRRMARCPFNDIFKQSKLGDALLLKYAKDKYCLPTEKYKKSDKKIPGGYVWESKPGLYENVAAFDWKSLYPNIILTFNLSLEKLHKNRGLTDDYIKIDNELLDGPFYFEKEKGLIPTLIEDLLEQRVEYKQKMKQAEYGTREYYALDHLQNAAKVFANGMFGALKKYSRMSHPYYIAGAITTMGQTINKKAAEIAEDLGYKVQYGDTDSIYLLMGNKTKEDLKTACKTVTKRVNAWLKEEYNVDNSTLVMEFESIFKRILFCRSASGKGGSKKRYAYLKIWDDGDDVNDIGIKGFASKRSDTPSFIREFQRDLFELILRGKEKDEVDEFINEQKKEFYTLREELGIPVGFSKKLREYGNLPQVRGARHSNKYHDTNFGEGDKVKWVYLKSSPRHLPPIDTIAFKKKIPDGYEIDYKKMYERLFEKKVQIVYDSIGWSNKKEQKGLSGF